jgi:hypothetical protein
MRNPGNSWRRWTPILGPFLARFCLTGQEKTRLTECRRLSALFWLLMLLPGGPASTRNPPGTLDLQASRLLTLLG